MAAAATKKAAADCRQRINQSGDGQCWTGRSDMIGIKFGSKRKSELKNELLAYNAFPMQTKAGGAVFSNYRNQFACAE